MTTSHPKVSPEYEPGGRSMVMPIPNPRRSPPSSRNGRKTTTDGRKRQKLSHTPENAPASSIRPQIGDEVRPFTGILTSQGSGSSDQSASKWYNAAAHDATPAPKQNAEIDDDPPFFMSNRAPYVPANFVASASDHHFGGGGFSRMDSENEDLRGVIDDLTVENKRLKQMIRSRQRTSHASPSDASTAQEKLFEVRMHGLPAEKRRELEILLKTFATSVHTSIPSKAASNSNVSGSNTSGSQNPALRTTPTTDSGYVSNSTSGAGFLPTQSMLHKPSNTKNVQSYLKDIPDTLLPRSNPAMSERAKHAIIVRRLEQLFTGRAAAAGIHDQPIQQQEISQSAARADRLQDAKENKKRKAEGNREARVMPPDTKVNLDTLSPLHSQDSKKKETPADLISRPGSPEQRPTRPLDLDIHRAQIAADNIAYLSHLGLSAPAIGGSSRDAEGNWMYLNLLSGLAQLHTLNVTPDQVRKAVKKLSKRLEVSKDGGKVRWIGGDDATKFPTEDEKAIEVADVTTHESTEDAGTGGTSSKRSKSNGTSNAPETSNTTSDDKMSGLQTSSDSKNPRLTSETSNLQGSSVPTKQTTTTNTSSAFDYKPIVYRQKFRQDLEDEMRDSDESYDSPSLGSSGLVNALSQSNLNQQNKEEGLITFFNNPFFCSDFSWERDPSNMLPPRPVVIGETLGLAVPADLPESPLRDADATYFTTQFVNIEPFDAEALPPAQKEKFERSLPVFPELQPISTAGEEETVPLSFDVCGLGGITPDDNFVLDVKLERESAPTSGPDVVTKTLPFSKRRHLQKFLTTITSCEKIELLPSKLPPPSYIFFTSSSSSGNNELNEDGEDSEEEDATSDSSSSPMVDEQYPAPPDFLQQFSGSSRENAGDDENDSKSSSEIDMLAIARKEYPREIAEQERQYMINQPGGIAGSLAATVGASRSSLSVRNAPVAGSMDSQMGSVGEDSDSDEDDMSDS